jgi:hypothetical protein
MRIDWLEPWCEVIDDAVGESLRAELLREVPRGHVLRGITAVKTLGYRLDQDDVAYLLPDGRVAVVHLTWTGYETGQAIDPTTELLDSIEALGKMVQEDHRDWK